MTQGLTFEKPERVPFRLTHNMVDAFGVYGCEGQSSSIVVLVGLYVPAKLAMIVRSFSSIVRTYLAGTTSERGDSHDDPRDICL